MRGLSEDYDEQLIRQCQEVCASEAAIRYGHVCTLTRVSFCTHGRGATNWLWCHGSSHFTRRCTAFAVDASAQALFMRAQKRKLKGNNKRWSSASWSHRWKERRRHARGVAYLQLWSHLPSNTPSSKCVRGNAALPDQQTRHQREGGLPAA